MKALTSTKHFGLAETFPLSVGKVRDIYDLDEQLLIIATDRVSAYDVVLPTPIPGRGIILTQMSLQWLSQLQETIVGINSPIQIDHHLVSADVKDLPDEFKPFADELAGRFMLVDKCDPLPVECIVRGYISGSMWKEYCRLREANQSRENITWLKHELPNDLQESQEFDRVLFTPSTKASGGDHDENIPYTRMVEILTSWVTEKGYDIDPNALAIACGDLSVSLYSAGRDYAKKHGIIIADTKFEFGIKVINGVAYLIIIDEVITSDSSRFWPADKYEIGRSQESFDKQIIRDYLAKTLGWDKQPPVPELPPEIVDRTIARYEECMTILFGDKPTD